MKSFSIKDVKGDGSCFFRSIYGAAKDKRGALKKLVKCFLYPEKLKEYKNDEELFVKDMRHKLCDTILHENDGDVIKNIYSTLIELSDENYKMVIEGFPSWMRKEFKIKPQSEKIFRKTIAERVLKNSTWVSEIEVNIVKDTLKYCIGSGLNIIILNTPPNKYFKPKFKTLYILNIGEVHYNYLSLHHL